MNKNLPLAIIDFKHLMAEFEPSLSTIYAQLLQHLSTSLPKSHKIYLLSSIEVYAFASAAAEELLAKIIKLANAKPVALVCNGCISFHAALFDFADSHYSQATFVFLEGPLKFLQQSIDSLNPDLNYNLSSQEGYAICTIAKYHSAMPQNAIYINQIEILSRQNNQCGFISTAQRLKEILKTTTIAGSCGVINFLNNSLWSLNLFKLVNKLVSQEAKLTAMLTWFAGCEGTNFKHFHSLKPLIDLDLYRDKLNLFDSCVYLELAGGGRVGVLQLAKTPAAELSYASANLNKISLNWQDPTGGNCLAAFKKKYILNENINTQNIYDTFFCLKNEYLFIDNVYFEWQLNP